MTRTHSGIALGALALLWAATAHGQSADIGAAAAVVPAVQGIRGDAAPRTLKVGNRVHAEERITVGDAGRAQLLFLDGTNLDVGPGSDLVLDRYVYDPDQDTGDMAVSMGKGVMRFVGGRISKRKKVKVKTPVGTVGIRGGIAMVSMDPAEGLTAVLIYGDEMTVTVGDITRTAVVPGMAVTVPIGAAPQPPARATPAQLGRMARPGSSGAAGPSGGAGGAAGPSGPVGGRTAGLSQRMGGFSAASAMASPLPGQQRPGAPGQPGTARPGMGGPLSQPAPGSAPPEAGGGPGPGGQPPADLPEGLLPDGMMPDGMMPDGMMPDDMGDPPPMP